jgi:hypothetical protein
VISAFTFIFKRQAPSSFIFFYFISVLYINAGERKAMAGLTLLGAWFPQIEIIIFLQNSLSVNSIFFILYYPWWGIWLCFISGSHTHRKKEKQKQAAVKNKKQSVYLLKGQP